MVATGSESPIVVVLRLVLFIYLGPVHTGTQSFRSILFRSKKWNTQGLCSHGNERLK